MKAVVFKKYGLLKNLVFEEVPVPIPKENEVLIEVKATSLNSWDLDILMGRPFVNRVIFGLIKPKINILGADIAGTIVSIGKKVKNFKIGDEVFGDLSSYGWGGFAEFVCAPTKTLTIKPKNVSFEAAAASPQAAVMALQSLERSIVEDKRILINGAGGGVGTYGIQFAKNLNAHVTAVDKKNKLNFLTSIGADEVIDYETTDYTKIGKKYDLIIDVVANRSIFHYKRTLAPGGKFVLIGGDSKTILQTIFLGFPLSIFVSKKLTILTHEPNKNLTTIGEFLSTGKISSKIHKIYPLTEVQKAFNDMEKGEIKGKVIISNQH